MFVKISGRKDSRDPGCPDSYFLVGPTIIRGYTVVVSKEFPRTSHCSLARLEDLDPCASLLVFISESIFLGEIAKKTLGGTISHTICHTNLKRGILSSVWGD
jgi:hypothetical protein